MSEPHILTDRECWDELRDDWNRRHREWVCGVDEWRLIFPNWLSSHGERIAFAHKLTLHKCAQLVHIAQHGFDHWLKAHREAVALDLADRYPCDEICKCGRPDAPVCASLTLDEIERERLRERGAKMTTTRLAKHGAPKEPRGVLGDGSIATKTASG